MTEPAPPRPASTGYLQEVQWSLPDAVFATVAGVLAGFIVLSGLATVRGTADLPALDQMIGLVVQGAATIAFVIWMTRARGSGPGAGAGLRIRPGDGWAFVLGMVLQLVVAILLGLLLTWLGETEPQQEVGILSTEASQGTAASVFVFFAVVVIAPVAEEVVFRGLLLSRLLRSLSPAGAVAVSAAVFSAIHLGGVTLLLVPGLFVVGLVLGWLALSGGDLSRPILAHMGVNFWAWVLLNFGDEITEYLERLETALGA